MAAITGTSISLPAPSRLLQQNQASGMRSVSLSIHRKSFPSLGLQATPLRFCVSCAAKTETVEKVCEIVKKQLALPADSSVTGDSTFTDLGADSLDTVEIVMGLEEEFGITVEEENFLLHLSNYL
uniref:Carrier domain-containing protein n=1 Tax=Nelumbo nucifera TaxID=4432 RepID=A0A822YZH4_NELNU|nr:TPA_asm: hypothetical protein HUJ06_008568 [Nelumbo nucifera]